MHQALPFEAVKQPGQGRPFDTNTLRQLTLGRRVFKTGQMQQHQPTRLGQPQASQATVQFGTPAARHLRQLHAKSVRFG
ncbi:hypothetical protein D3C87_2119400 [compost metagenome]